MQEKFWTASTRDNPAKGVVTEECMNKLSIRLTLLMTLCAVTVKQGQLVVGIATIYHAARVTCEHVRKAPDHKFNRSQI